MLESELRGILRELATEVGAERVSIVREEEDGADAKGAIPLGGGAFLVLESGPPEGAEAEAAVERAARAIRACARRWDADVIPALVAGAAAPSADRVRERIDVFLRGLVGDQSADNAIVSLRGHVVGAAHEPDELQVDRVPFMLKRLDAEAGRLKGKSSHAEISGDDFYAVSFWYGAALIAFFTKPFSLDFVRHRARRVTHELSLLMGDLDDPPRDPARVAPVPD